MGDGRPNPLTAWIAAASMPIAGFAPGFRLVVVGAGPLLHRLRAHAADLRVSSRVHFLGAVADLELYRWLRTARVVVALHDDHSSGIHVGEALAAGAPLVASELPVHREAAARFDGARVKFVSPRGSPFEVADAIPELLSIPENGRRGVAWHTLRLALRHR
jgi:glycosyltransferase involved in cell wall biosynthesis